MVLVSWDVSKRKSLLEVAKSEVRMKGIVNSTISTLKILYSVFVFARTNITWRAFLLCRWGIWATILTFSFTCILLVR